MLSKPYNKFKKQHYNNFELISLKSSVWIDDCSLFWANVSHSFFLLSVPTTRKEEADEAGERRRNQDAHWDHPNPAILIPTDGGIFVI